MLVPDPRMEELKPWVAQGCSPPLSAPMAPGTEGAEGDPWGHRKVGAQEPPQCTVLASAGREPYTVCNWHQMLPDLLHPPGSWKHLFV